MIVESKRQSKNLPTARPSVLILGVGDALLSDWGAGVHVIRALSGIKLPDNVELLDSSTASILLPDTLNGREKIVIIGAIKGNGQPGTIYRFTHADIREWKEIIAALHQIGTTDSLTLSQFLADAPQNVVIFGIEPEEIDWGMNLSTEIAAVVPKVIELILKELGMPAPQDE